MRRRNLLGATALMHLPYALAQDGAGVVNVVVPFSAGSESDVVARLYAKFLSAALKRTVVVMNRPGGGGTLASRAVLQAKPDGNTLLVASPAFIVAPLVNPSADYDPLKDFSAVGGLNASALVLMSQVSNPELGSIAAMVARAKKSPGKLTYGGNGIGTYTHLLMESFSKEAGIELTYVPYKGLQEASQALMGGQLDLALEGPNGAISRIQTGRVRPILIFDDKPEPRLPGVPTPVQAGFPQTGRMSIVFSGIVASSKTPPATLLGLREASRAVLVDPEFAQELRKLGVRPYAPSSDEIRVAMEQMQTQVESVAKSLERAGRKITVN